MGPQPFGCGRVGPPHGRHARPCASMGPQPFGCGRSAYIPARICSKHGLQWGRNLSVAEGATSRRRPMGSGQLQWGRNLSVAEGDTIHKIQDINYVASMGPQPFGCGRRVVYTPFPDTVCASMGPQPFGCGRLLAPALGRATMTSFNGAATFRLRKEPHDRAASAGP